MASSLAIHYRQRGKRERKPSVLLVHGAGGGSVHFDSLLDPLSRDRKVVALDLPGHGKSPAAALTPPDGELIDGYVDSIAEFGERIGLGRFIFVGHSMGGAIGLAFALKYPDRLAGLGLIASSARLPVSMALLTQLDEQFQHLPKLFAQRSYSPACDRSKVRRLVASQLQCGKEQLLADFRACRTFDLRGALGEIEHPTVIVSGLDDIITPPRMQRQLEAGLRYAELLSVPRAGHFVHRERPEPVLDALRQLCHRALPLSPPLH